MRTLQRILDQAGRDFYRIDRRWQPKDLLPTIHSKPLLEDVGKRLDLLKDAEEEFQQLKRSGRYLGIIKRMQINLRRARFSWRQDDLVFLQAISELYQDYGTILQMLKTDEARGMLNETETEQGD